MGMRRTGSHEWAQMSLGDDDSESSQATPRIGLIRVVMGHSVPAEIDMRQQWIAKCAA